MFGLVFVEEPIDFCVRRNERRQGLSLISKVYSSYSKEEHEAIWDEKRRRVLIEQKRKGKNT